MATLNQRRVENVSGDFYVDASCIDCDTCRWMAPQIFNRQGSQSAVYYQPTGELEEQLALQALLSCPTASIGTVDKPTHIKQVQQEFPLLIADNVYHCGYHAEASFGAASYLIQRPEGNVLVDSPRFTPPLIKRLAAIGGVRYLFLTHKDDVADHQKFHEYFGCERILHQDELQSDTKDVEIKLSGSEPIEFASDLLLIPVPGHSEGHTVLLYQNKFLFSGDHLAWSPYLNHLYAFRRFCWYSWTKQIKSMAELANYNFEWVLPGHGRRYHGSFEEVQEQMQLCLAWMKQD